MHLLDLGRQAIEGYGRVLGILHALARAKLARMSRTCPLLNPAIASSMPWRHHLFSSVLDTCESFTRICT